MYATNVPVIKAVCEVITPKGIMELGCGLNSTVLIYDYDGDNVSIETDLDWFEDIKKICPDKDNFQLLRHPLRGGISRRTMYEDLSEEDISQAMSFYQSVIDKHDCNCLFIDHLTCFRYPSLQNLYDQFDIVAYHDADDTGDYYRYGKFELQSNDFYHWVYKSFDATTGILIRKKYKDKLQEFEESLKRYEKEFCKEKGTSCSYIMEKIA